MTQKNDKDPVRKDTGTGKPDHAGKAATSRKPNNATVDATGKKRVKEKSPDPSRPKMNLVKDHADRKNPKSS